MKRLHRPDLYGWTVFDTARNLDFHSVLWVREGDNVVVDPLPLTPHDRAHLDELGGVGTIVVTNSDHLRDTTALAASTGARVLGPAAERGRFPVDCNGWLADGDEVVPGLVALALDGSKSPGELALVLKGSTLITGDLIRAHAGGALCLLPDAKLGDKARAIASVARRCSPGTVGRCFGTARRRCASWRRRWTCPAESPAPSLAPQERQQDQRRGA